MSGCGHFLLSAETTFSAAHRLPGAGECEQLHGHNWQVRLTVRVEEEQLDDSGIGADFRVIEEIARAWQEPGKRLFLVKTGDNKIFQLCYNEAEGRWSLIG